MNQPDPQATPDRALEIITQRLGAWYRPDYQPTEMDAKVAGDIAARLAHAGIIEIDRGNDA